MSTASAASPNVPRLRPVTPESADGQTIETMEQMRKYMDPSNVVLATIMWNRELTEYYIPFSEYLKHHGCLPPRHREIVILRTAWNCGADYQWVVHTEYAGTAGLTPEEIERVARGADDPGWTPLEGLLVMAVDELHGDRRISSDTWTRLSESLGNDDLIELLFLVGNYEMIALVMNSIAILPPKAPPDLPGNRFRTFAPSADGERRSGDGPRER